MAWTRPIHPEKRIAVAWSDISRAARSRTHPSSGSRATKSISITPEMIDPHAFQDIYHPVDVCEEINPYVAPMADKSNGVTMNKRRLMDRGTRKRLGWVVGTGVATAAALLVASIGGPGGSGSGVKTLPKLTLATDGAASATFAASASPSPASAAGASTHGATAPHETPTRSQASAAASRDQPDRSSTETQDSSVIVPVQGHGHAMFNQPYLQPGIAPIDTELCKASGGAYYPGEKSDLFFSGTGTFEGTFKGIVEACGHSTQGVAVPAGSIAVVETDTFTGTVDGCGSGIGSFITHSQGVANTAASSTQGMPTHANWQIVAGSGTAGLSGLRSGSITEDGTVNPPLPTTLRSGAAWSASHPRARPSSSTRPTPTRRPRSSTASSAGAWPRPRRTAASHLSGPPPGAAARSPVTSTTTSPVGPRPTANSPSRGGIHHRRHHRWMRDRGTGDIHHRRLGRLYRLCPVRPHEQPPRRRRRQRSRFRLLEDPPGQRYGRAHRPGLR